MADDTEQTPQASSANRDATGRIDSSAPTVDHHDIPRDPRAKTARRIGSRRKAPRRSEKVAADTSENAGQTGSSSADSAATNARANRKSRSSRGNRKNKLKRLNRRDLLELLEDLSRENDRLRAQLAEANRKLEDRAALMENCGSMAEASMALADVFKAADRAAHIYVESCKRESAKLRTLNAQAAQESEEARHGVHTAHSSDSQSVDESSSASKAAEASFADTPDTPDTPGANSEAENER